MHSWPITAFYEEKDRDPVVPTLLSTYPSLSPIRRGIEIPLRVHFPVKRRAGHLPVSEDVVTMAMMLIMRRDVGYDRTIFFFLGGKRLSHSVTEKFREQKDVLKFTCESEAGKKQNLLRFVA